MRRLAALLALLSVVMFAAQSAQGATNHTLSATIRSAAVATEGNRTVVAGVVNGGLGEGATVARLHPLSTPNRMTGPFTTWYVAGTFHGTATYTFSAALPNGNIPFTGTGQVTGGTGRFHNATGSFTTRGTLFTNGHSTQRATGTLRY